jgi:hypothetical protein
MLMGEMLENVANGIDCYSLRQPLGVRTPNCACVACRKPSLAASTNHFEASTC